MKKINYLLALAILVIGTSIVLAGVGNNDKNGWQVNGKHYNLNIIAKDKHGEVGDSDGHTMFVKDDGRTRITMTQSVDGEFYVTDRNGLDGKAAFNIAPGHYNIYARGLGKPGGNVNITAMGNFTDAETGTQLINLGYVNIARDTGKPQSVNINELFYVDVTLCTSFNGTDCIEWVEYEDFWVFDIEELLEYFWDYDNNGLKVLQVRFYECTLDASGEASDYCRWGNGSPIDSNKH